MHWLAVRNSLCVRDVATRMRFMRQWKVIIGADADADGDDVASAAPRT
jgi:hypothetical protein